MNSRIADYWKWYVRNIPVCEKRTFLTFGYVGRGNAVEQHTPHIPGCQAAYSGIFKKSETFFTYLKLELL